jgi:hypothetical protein
MSELRNPILIIILIVSIVVGSSRLTRGHEWGDDFAAYVMQAKSILNGDMQSFVEHNSVTIYQSSSLIGPVAYPWGYPLILTSVYSVKGVSPLALKLPGFLFFVGFLICFYLLMRNRLTRTESLLIVSLFAFNPMFLGFLDQILSDIPFLFFSTLALLLMTKYEEKQSLFQTIILGGVIFFAFFIRTTGIVLLAGFLAYQILCIYRKNKQSKIIMAYSAAVLFTFFFLWLISSLIFPNGQSTYFDQLKGFTSQTFTRNISGYVALFRFFFGTFTAWIYIYYVLAVFFFVGIWTRRNTDLSFIIFFVIYFGLILIWPEWQGQRFIFPLIPFFIYFTFQGMKSVISKLPGNYHRSGRWVFYGFWLSIIGIFLFNSSIDAYANLQNNRSINGPFDEYSMEVYNYIKEKTPPDSVIIFFKPRAMRLMTDHDTLMSTECERLSLGNYIVLSRKAGENQQIAPEQINTCKLPLDEVLKNRRFAVYEILK